jgi:biotin carboxyl carrier protein
MRRIDLVLRGVGGTAEDLRLESDGAGWRLTRDGAAVAVTAERLPDGRLSLLFPDGRQVCGRARVENGKVRVETSAGAVLLELADPLRDRIAHDPGADRGEAEEEVRATMPGRVLEVLVAEGDRVAAGDVLVVLEAMKMQNEIRASAGGTVARCAVSPGDAVEGRALLLVLSSGSPS